MNNDEYHIPVSAKLEGAEPNGATSKSHKPESHKPESTEPPVLFSVESDVVSFEHIKAIEENIFAHRDVYLQNVATQKSSRHNLLLSGLMSSRQNEPRTIEELIEHESRYGGAIFGNENKFWLNGQANYGGSGFNSGFNNWVSDWYHVQPNPNDPKYPLVLHFQTTPQSVHKLYEAREYPMEPAEVQQLFKAITAYHDIIVPLYQQKGAVVPLRRHKKSA